MSERKAEIASLIRWRDVGDGPTCYTAGNKQFADDVIVALSEIDRITSERDELRAALDDILATTKSHVDGRDLLDELHPRKTLALPPAPEQGGER